MGKKTYILDTNVLIHDPESIFHFQENEVIIPFEALEELDKLKKRYDQTGHNARQTIRHLGDLAENGCLNEGLQLTEGGVLKVPPTFLWNEKSKKTASVLSQELSQNIDNRIIALAWFYKQKHNGNTIFVSKDINARVKAQALGIRSEDYKTDKIDISTIYTGHTSLVTSQEVIGALHEQGEVNADSVKGESKKLFENQCILLTSEKGSSALAIHKNGILKKINHSHSVFWGVKPKNKDQQYSIELLADNTIQAVSLMGKAGTGKTILALAVGLHKVLEEGVYQRIFVTKPVVPVGRQDIGFLPGDKEDKMLPWVQSIFDNLVPLSSNNQKMTLDYLTATHLLEIESIAHMRGRSIAKSWIIIDEAQNLTPHEVKTILSRVGEGSKIVLTGDIYQIDSPYLDAGSNGLSYLVSKLKGQAIYGHIMLNKTIRSALASLAAELL
jgi:PhoH-like ATPase